MKGLCRNAVIHGLHYWINHPHLVKGRYARVTLSRVVRRHRKELVGLKITVPDKDAEEAGFYDCAERIITEVNAPEIS
jgi:hypothetical protein